MPNEPVIVFVKSVTPRKKTSELTKNMQEGRHIHQKLEKLGEATATQLVLATGYDRNRIEQHIKWALEDGYAKIKN